MSRVLTDLSAIDLTDIAAIKQILREHNLTPRKKFGRNFLIDRAVLDKIVAAIDLTEI